MICPSCNHHNVPGADQCSNCWHDLAPFDRPVALDRVHAAMMNVTEIVLRHEPAATLAPARTVGEPIQVMPARSPGAVPVVDEAGQLVGMFAERDVLERVGGGCDDYANQPVAEFMTTSPETVRESDTLAFALHKMDSGGYRHLPVLRGGRLV